MTKGKAMLMAAGVAMALLGGAVALALGLSGGTSAVAETPKKLDPIVRTVHRTVKVEKPAKGSGEQVRVVEVGTTPQTQGDALSTGADDDSFEGEDHESDEHEGDDSGSEDHASTGGESHDEGSGDD